MYLAKSFGGQCFRFFSHEINQRLIEKMALESQLRRALEEDEFVLHYQPQFDVITGRIVGVEALVRWQHPEHGLVMPNQFIPLMEETGMILALGEWVLRAACRQIRQWRETHLPDLRMGINISACQFRQSGFLELTDRILAECAVDPGWIEFELTESMIMDDTERSCLLLAELKRRGIRLALDDFGTGYSSLSYLKNFPLDRIKIDRSFLVEVAHNRDDAAIVEAIITMAASLNLKVVAEGVENLAQFEFIARRGCHESQGYLFSRPLTAETLSRLFSEGVVTSSDARYTSP
jgi:EAL domain-containing protein (putative c-di-GMP-specific phosphodiesterase class I)